MNIEQLYLFIGASLLLALSPGPDNIFVMVQSMTYGFKRGFTVICGLMTGCLVHTTLVALGVSILIKQSPLVFLGLKIAGALYLLYLAYKVYVSDSSLSIQAGESEQKSLLSLYLQGFLMNVLNPKVALFFLALFPGFLFHLELSTVLQFYVLGGLFILSSLLVFSGLAYLAGRISSYVQGHANLGSYLKWGQIVVFIAIALIILS